MSKEYIRTDRNGTRIYHDYTCPKCGGTGRINAYNYFENGVCFKCGGYGVLDKPIVYKEYTPEYEAKLAERRRIRFEKKREEARAKAAEINAKFYERKGFSSEGKTFIVIGDTYEIKDELKAMGAKWDNGLYNFAGYGWHLPEDTNKYPTVEADVNEMYPEDYAGRHEWNHWNYSEDMIDRVAKAAEDLVRQNSHSEYIGEIKDKITIKVTYTNHTSWINPYDCRSKVYLHIFEDENENVYVWRTAKNLSEIEEGAIISLMGTIKKHKEYRGIKQTVLTRCKVL